MFSSLLVEASRLDELQSKLDTCVSLLCKVKYTSLKHWHKFYLTQGGKEITTWGAVFLATQGVNYITPLVGVATSPTTMAILIKVSIICGVVRGATSFVPDDWEVVKEIHNLSKTGCGVSLLGALGNAFEVALNFD